MTILKPTRRQPHSALTPRRVNHRSRARMLEENEVSLRRVIGKRSASPTHWVVTCQTPASNSGREPSPCMTDPVYFTEITVTGQ